MRSHQRLLIDFVLAKSESEPVGSKAALFRALADFCGDEKEGAKFCALASELEAADARCRQFAFELTEKFNREARR